MKSEVELFLFHYLPGTLPSLSDGRILWLFSHLHRYDPRIVNRSKSIGRLLGEVPDHVFSYLVSHHYHELSYWLEETPISERVEAIRKSPMSLSLSRFLRPKSYVTSLHNLGNDALAVSLDTRSLTKPGHPDVLLHIRDGHINLTDLRPHFPDRTANDLMAKRALKDLHSDIDVFTYHNKLRLLLAE